MGLALFIIVVLFQTPAVSSSHGNWRSGRATYYGEKHDGTNDGFSIHHGSCQFGQLDPDVGTGWDIAALPDVHHEYHGSCGRCYEMACEPMVFTDNYGESLDRTDACIDPEKTVIVTIVDVCPCNYAKNFYSNKRWCCGDMDHFDVSIYAFEKIGMMDKGVIGIKYRPVPCPGADEKFVTTPPEALAMPSFPSDHEEVSDDDLANVRKAIKEASGSVVVISDGELPKRNPKPSGVSEADEKEPLNGHHPDEPAASDPDESKEEELSEIEPPSKPTAPKSEEEELPKSQPPSKPTTPKFEEENEPESSPGLNEDDLETSLPETDGETNASEPASKPAEKKSVSAEGDESQKAGDEKEPSSVPATVPSILLTVVLLLVHLMV